MRKVSTGALVGKRREGWTLILMKAGLVALLVSITFGHECLLAAEQPGTEGSPINTTDLGDRAATMNPATKSNAFREVLKQLGAGQKPEPKLWSTFVAAQNDGLKTGPKIGAKVPDFTLSDQDGKQLSLHELMGPKGLLLIFSRSADWCPFCRSQLVELQESAEALRRNGINPASITYDSQEVLRRFSDTYHISYPMLSDKGSVVIRKFGILNTNVPPDVTRFYGMPFPGQYLIGPDGTVKDKLFLPDFEERPTASEVLLKDFGVGRGSVAIKAQDVNVKVIVSDTQSYGGHRLGVMVAFEVAPGWHIYGSPLPPEYRITRVKFSTDLVQSQTLKFPASTPLTLEALGQTLPVYQGSFKAVGHILLKQPLPTGNYKLAGTIEFQECNDTECKIPQSVPFALPLKIDPLVPAAPKA